MIGEEKMAKIITKRKTSAGGLVLELLGLILLFAFPIGTLLGIVFIIVGFNMSKSLACSECKNRIEDKEVKLCPVCKAAFS